MNQKNRKIFDLAFNYVCTFPNVTPAIVEEYFNDYERTLKNVVSIEDIYLKMLQSPLSIVRYGHAIGDVKSYKKELKGFNPNEILRAYPSWKDFFWEMEKSGKSKIPMDIEKKGTYWCKFSRTVIDAAKYLSRFQDSPTFRKYVEKHISEKKQVELIKTICKDPETRVFGFGWPLACQFLKEIGYTDFIKMDSHLTAILSGLGIVSSTSGEEAYKQSIEFAESIGEKPFAVDKLFYLAGSGKLYLTKYHNTETNDEKIIQYIKAGL